jgi:hypothetical protein
LIKLWLSRRHRKILKREETMTAFRKASLAGMILLVSAFALAQTEDATRIMNQANGGVVALVMYGPDKAEVAKASAMALTEDILCQGEEDEDRRNRRRR